MFDDLAAQLTSAIGSWDRIQKRRRMRALVVLSVATLAGAWFVMT